MQDTRKKLELLVNSLGFDMKQVSLGIGKNPTYIQQYVRRGVPQKLDGDTRKEICRFMGQPDDCLEIDNLDKPAEYPATHFKVPVYGYAAGSNDRIAINDGNIVGMRERGPALAYAKNGFYALVIGESMEPRLKAGEYIAINPSMPPVRNEECVVQFTSGEAIVKTFVARNEKTITLSQYNPPKNLEIDLRQVVDVFPVVAIERAR